MTTLPPGGFPCHSFSLPVHLKAALLAEINYVVFFCVVDAKCTQVSTFLSLHTIIDRYTHMCIGRVVFCFFFWLFLYDYSTSVATIVTQTKNPTGLFSFHSDLARLFREVRNALYSLSQIWVRGCFFSSTLSHLIAINLSFFFFFSEWKLYS